MMSLFSKARQIGKEEYARKVSVVSNLKEGTLRRIWKYIAGMENGDGLEKQKEETLAKLKPQH